MEFISNPRRDASSVIAGYVYQVDETISRWLNLEANETLELERGEDLDVIQVSDDHLNDLRTLEQVKVRASPLTLRSVGALEALANFCEHRQANPASRLKFRYVTTSRIGRESGWTEAVSGIELWGAIRAGELGVAEEGKAVSAIRIFLQNCKKPRATKTPTWSFLQRVLAADNEADLRDVIQSLQ